MTKLQYVSAMAAICAITFTTALTHSYLEAGWRSKSEVDVLASKLRELPDSFGDWTRTERKEIPSKILRILKCYGYISETYQNSRSGAVVSVAVLFGPRGPIAVHTPEICYSSVGTQPVGGRRMVSVDSGDQKDEFWKIQFSKNGVDEPSFEVWYAWSDGGPWQASDHPRYWVTDHLYKLQLSGDPTTGAGISDGQSFLENFLPVLRTHLEKN